MDKLKQLQTVKVHIEWLETQISTYQGELEIYKLAKTQLERGKW